MPPVVLVAAIAPAAATVLVAVIAVIVAVVAAGEIAGRVLYFQLRKLTLFRLNSIFTWCVIGIVLIGVAGVGYYFYSRMQVGAPRYSTERTVFSVLMEGNPHFAEGNELVLQRDFSAARSKFAEARLLAQDAVQESYITYWIASMDEAIGDYRQAISGYKHVAASSLSPNILRAYAVMRIGLLPTLGRYSEQRAAIVEETFKDEPYSSFFVPQNEAISYRQLHEYASSFYPVSVSELSVANWHLNQIAHLQEVGIVDHDEYEAHATAALERIRNAKMDMERSLQNETATLFLPTAYAFSGRVHSKFVTVSRHEQAPLAFGGTALEQEGLTLEAAEDAFVWSLAMLESLGKTDGYERFHYVTFLNIWYPDRVQDITTLLAKFYEDESYKDDPVMQLFQASRDGRGSWESGSLVSLAALDPQFKNLLVSLDWSESDFAAPAR